MFVFDFFFGCGLVFDDDVVVLCCIFIFSMLNWLVCGLLEDVLLMVWIEGELFNVVCFVFGYLYFMLKDVGV